MAKETRRIELSLKPKSDTARTNKPLTRRSSHSTAYRYFWTTAAVHADESIKVTAVGRNDKWQQAVLSLEKLTARIHSWPQAESIADNWFLKRQTNERQAVHSGNVFVS